jgi:hypothetical protein
LSKDQSIQAHGAQLVQKVLKKGLNEYSVEQFHGALRAGVKYDVSRKTLLPAYLQVINSYWDLGRTVEALETCEEARLVNPIDLRILELLSEVLRAYWHEFNHEMCRNDLLRILEYIENIVDDTSHHSASNYIATRLGSISSLKTRISSSLSHALPTQESKHTFFLDTLAQRKFGNLTPEERKKAFSELVSEKVRERLKKNQPEDSSSSEDKPNA